MKKVLLIALVIVLVSGLILGGCAKPAPAPPTAPAPPPPGGPPPGGPPPAQVKPIELTYAHDSAPTSARGRAIEEWAKSIEEAANGRVIITIYPSESLVASPDQYPSLLAGEIDITMLPLHIVPEMVLETVYNLPALPWTPENYSTIKNELGKEFPQIAAGRSNVKTVHHTDGPPFVVNLHKAEARVPDDMKGLKLCGPRSIVPFIEALGAAAAALHPPDFYVSLETGVIDGILANYDTLDHGKLTEVTDFHINVPIMASHGFVLMNLDTWNSLPPDIQQIVDGSVGEAQQKFHDYQFEIDDIIYNELVADPAHKVVEPTADELALWHGVAQPIHQVWIDDMEGKGLPGQAAYDKIIEIIARYK